MTASSGLLCDLCAEGGLETDLPCPMHEDGRARSNGTAPGEHRTELPTPDDDEVPGASWAPVDLAAVLGGDLDEPLPMIFERDDGVPLFYAGRVNAIFGEPESGKSWAAQAACAGELVAGRRVVYVDFEDQAAGVVARMLALGVPEDVLLERFVYIRPEDAMAIDKGDPRRDHLMAAVAGASLVVFDGVTACYGLHGWEINSNDDAADFDRGIAGLVAKQGPAVLLIDHQTKARDDRRGFALGAQHKKAAIRGAGYSAHSTAKPAPGRTGVVTLMVEKDTPGQVRRHLSAGERVAAVLTFRSDGKRMSVSVTAKAVEQPPGAFRPTNLMERMSRWLELNPGASSREILAEVTGKRSTLSQALGVLIGEGWVLPTKKGRRTEHHVAKPYREAADPLDQLETVLGAVPVEGDDDEPY